MRRFWLLPIALMLALPLALAGGGSYVTLKPGSHTLTNIDVIRKFVPVAIETIELEPDVWRIQL